MKMEGNEKETGKVDTPEGTGDGDKSKTPQSIVDANEAAKRLEDATAKHKIQLDRQEDMIARKILGGSTEAGQKPAAKKEVDPEQYAKDVLAGKITNGKED